MPDEKPRPKDPHLGLRFWIEIDGCQVAGFSECSGLQMETEVFEYAEGGLNTGTHKLPGRLKFANITLKRGLDPGADLQKWFVECIEGRTKGRKNVSILVYGPLPNDEVRRWDLRGAYPVKWSGPDLKTDAGAVAVETLEIAFAGLQDR